jgi:hypothetical protein
MWMQTNKWQSIKIFLFEIILKIHLFSKFNFQPNAKMSKALSAISTIRNIKHKLKKKTNSIKKKSKYDL